MSGACTIPPAGWYCSRGDGHEGPCAATCSAYRYGKWTIDFGPKPIPTRKFDYSFWHDDYDGAPDSFDNRAGTAASVEEAKAEIDIIEDMDRDLTEAENGQVEQALDKFKLLFRVQELERALTECSKQLRRAAKLAGNADWAINAMMEQLEAPPAKARGDV